MPIEDQPCPTGNCIGVLEPKYIINQGKASPGGGAPIYNYRNVLFQCWKCKTVEVIDSAY